MHQQQSTQSYLLLLAAAALALNESNAFSSVIHVRSKTSILPKWHTSKHPRRRTIIRRGNVSLFFNSKQDQRQDDDINDDVDNVISSEHDNGSTTNMNLTALQTVRILFYRFMIASSALLISIQAIGNLSFLDGTGINVDSVLNSVQQTQSVLPFVTGLGLLTCPVPKQKAIEIGAIVLGSSTITCGILSSITNHQQVPLEQLSWILAILVLVSICIREIWYFGVEYKQECALSLFMLPLMIFGSSNGSVVPFAVPLCALGLCVLAAGKVFEPLEEDLIRSNSEFLAK